MLNSVLTSFCFFFFVMFCCFNLIFFFFSSRRRHTRCLSDWSSACALPIYPRVGPLGGHDAAGGARVRRARRDVSQGWRPVRLPPRVDGTPDGVPLRLDVLR